MLFLQLKDLNFSKEQDANRKPIMIKRTYHYIIVGIACFIACLFMYADNGKLYFSDKLSSSLINCVAQDRYGFIWVGTEFGLSKFDGYRFTNYLHDGNDTTSISDNIITDFLVDSDGRLWIGTARGLMRYDYQKDCFVRYVFSDKRTPRIYSIIESRKGDVLLGSAGFGLYSIRKGTDKGIQEKEYCPRDSDMFYTHIFEDIRGDLWQSSHLSDFHRFHRENGKMRTFNYSSPCGAPVAFFQQRSNQLLVVCMFGILYYDYPSQKLLDAGYDFGEYKDEITINSATFDGDGNLYLGTSERGVLFVANGSKVVTSFENKNDQRFNLSTSWVNDIMEDKDENLWIACYKKGLYLVNNQKEAFSSWSFSGQETVIGSSVSSLAMGDNGETWCAVQNSGVFRFDNKGKIIGHPASPLGTSLIYRDKKGDYWIGTGNGLYSYQPEAGTYQARLKFSSAGIYCLTEDDEGRFYISVYSKGLYIYDSNTDEVKVLNNSMKSKNGELCNDWIRSLMFDSSGLLWIGTSDGVSCLDPHTYSFKTFGWTTLLPYKQANYFCEDKDGNIIIGTNEGLYKYDTKNDVLDVFPHSDALKNVPICGIVKDKQNDIWISTTKGIWQYDQRTNSFSPHVSGNGLRSSEYVHGAVAQSSDDRIAFGTVDGITAFYPDEVRDNRVEMGKVYLTNFIVDGKSLDFSQKKFVLPYSQNSFSLEFSLLNYKNDPDVVYQYRVNGDDWRSTAEGTNVIPFNKLAPGNYKIEVRAASNGVFSEEITTIPVKVLSPWYASTWAYLMYILLACIIIFLIIWSYERHRKIDMEEQQMRFLINATHDIRSPLTLIMGPLGKLRTRVTDEQSLQDIDTIDRNAQRLLLLVNQILDERKIDKHQMKLSCEETDLVMFIRYNMHLFSFQAQERNISMRLYVDGVDVDSGQEYRDVKAWIDHANFDKVIANLISNAMKYSFANGSIDVFITADDREVEIKIVDTGEGFEDDHTDRLFERFYQGKNSSHSHEEGTGIGLNLSRSIVEMHGGHIKAYNRKDGVQGACVQINLPLGKSHLKPDEIKSSTSGLAGEEDTKTQASRNIRVLMVDDDYEIARYVKNELSRWYRFDYAPNGQEAMKKLLSGKFDIIISDIVMPVMDGIDLLKQVKRNSNVSDIPIILLTSKNEVESRLEGLQKGADAYISKPFNMDELHVTIDNLVDNVRRLRGKFSGAQSQEEKVENVTVKGNNDQLMERIMKCINQNLSDPDFNVESLIKEVGISRAHLHRKMKEITGISTGEFIRNLRLEQAARLIKEGTVNVTQVAYAVGFNNQAHFSTVFKKHFGVPPSEYAEKMKDTNA